MAKKDKEPEKPKRNQTRKGMAYKKSAPIVQSHKNVECKTCHGWFMPKLSDINDPVAHNYQGKPCNY